MVKKKTKKNYAVLLTCLLLAMLAWFIVKMTVNYTATYALEVVFYNLPENKVLVNQSDTMLNVVFEDKGLSLLPLELSSKKLKIDYDKITSSYQKKYNHICVQEKQLKEYIANAHKFSKNIKSIQPTRICIQLQDEIEK
ncbi:MAG: hypothetical protein PHC83_03615 [Bacteroidales bacterium]|nr:hypothetical protein [Bacteroidales bacterium]MDD4209478.1 hypothetical protein [Bacteroidales bacterium]